ncbi:MAG: TlpA disulfide reductase family protein [Deferrisomatales bacterium]|nr:TlpA disulfide reductase family protein [Deferrisomatales bacterium]
MPGSRKGCGRALLGLVLTAGLFLGCSGGEPPSHGRTAAPGFRLQTLDGREVRLADYRGKVVLLHFWATWCPPCLEAMPYEMELQKKYGPDGFAVLGLNMDRKVDAARAYLAKHPVNYPMLVLDDATRQAFGGVPTIPYTVLVDRDGFIRKQELGYGEDGRVALERKIGILLGVESAS